MISIAMEELCGRGNRIFYYYSYYYYLVLAMKTVEIKQITKM